MTQHEESSHSRDQIWQAVGEVAKQQASTDARIGALETAVDAGFRSLQSSIEGISRKQNAPFPVWNMVSAVGVMAVILGGYATLITQPLYTVTEQQHAQIERLESVRSNYEGVKARVEILEKEVAKQAQFDTDASFIHGQRDSLEKRVEDIDRLGSRKWIDASEDR